MNHYEYTNDICLKNITVSPYIRVLFIYNIYIYISFRIFKNNYIKKNQQNL